MPADRPHHKHIPEILDLQIGPSLSAQDKQRGYAYGFVMHFAGKGQLDLYAVNALHRAAGAELRTDMEALAKH